MSILKQNVSMKNVAIIVLLAMMLNILAGFAFMGVNAENVETPSTVKYEENFDSYISDKDLTEEGWTVSGATAKIVERGTGDMCVEVQAVPNVDASNVPLSAYVTTANAKSQNGDQPITGSSVIVSFDFNIKSVSEHKAEQLVFKDAANANTVAVLQIDGANNTDKKFNLSYATKSGSNYLTNPFASNLNFDSWYTVVMKLNSFTGKYDLFLLDDAKETLAGRANLPVRYDFAEGSAADIGFIYVNNYFNVDGKAANFKFDNFSICNNASYELPEVPKAKAIMPGYTGNDGSIYYKEAYTAKELKSGEYGITVAGNPTVTTGSITKIAGLTFPDWRVWFGANTATTVKFDVPEAGKYKIEWGAKHAMGTGAKAQVNGGAEKDLEKTAAEADKNAAGEYWNVIGTYDLTKGTNTMVLAVTGGNMRVDLFRITKVGESTPVIKLDENFNDEAVSATEVDGWNKGLGDTFIIAEKATGDNYLKVGNSTTSKTTVLSPKVSSLNADGTPVSGANIVASVKFNVEQVGATALMNFKTKSGNTPIDFAFKKISEDGFYALDYRYGPMVGDGWGTYADWNKKLELGTWYQLIISMDSSAGKYDFYLADEDGNYIDSIKGVVCRLSEDDLKTPNVDLDYLQVNNMQSGTIIGIDDVYIENNANYQFPEDEPVPEGSPVIEGTPQPDGSIWYMTSRENITRSVQDLANGVWENGYQTSNSNFVGIERSCIQKKDNMTPPPADPITTDDYMEISIDVETAGWYEVQAIGKYKSDYGKVEVNDGGRVDIEKAAEAADSQNQRWTDILGTFELNQGTNKIKLYHSGTEMGNLRLDVIGIKATTAPSPEISPSPSPETSPEASPDVSPAVIKITS